MKMNDNNNYNNLSLSPYISLTTRARAIYNCECARALITKHGQTTMS